MKAELALVPNSLGVAVRSIEVMEENIKIAQKEIQAEILEQCKADEHRLLICETKLRQFPDFIKKLNAFNTSLTQMKGLEGDIKESKLFIERQLPALIHMQLCEGLHVVAGNQMDELKEFETQKLEELFYHNKENQGKQPQIGKFRQRIEWIIKILKEDRLGMAPFVFKPNRDYWPDMREGHMKIYGEDKLKYFKDKERNH